MKSLLFVTFIVLFSCITKAIYCSPPKQNEKNELILVHAIFRHGDRTKDVASTYPKDPYINETYFPYGLGELTNQGKLTQYNLGKFLRGLYDHFLGPLYFPDILEARSTDFSRTKASLQLVLAGLFPPTGILKWNSGLNWQPIPYNYVPLDQDKILFSVLCPNFLPKFLQYLASAKMLAFVKENRKVFEYLSQQTGLNVDTISVAGSIYFTLVSEFEFGFKLPEWTTKVFKVGDSLKGPVFPDLLLKYTLQTYLAYTATDELKKIVSGPILQKIVRDTQAKINGTNEARKIFLYSGHEFNVATVLNTLGIFKPLHVPAYGSCLIFEIYKKDDEYGVKIFYRKTDTEKPILMKLPMCEELCPWDKFVSIAAEYFPSDGTCG